MYSDPSGHSAILIGLIIGAIIGLQLGLELLFILIIRMIGKYLMVVLNGMII